MMVISISPLKLRTMFNTYSIQEPSNGAVSPTHQNPVLMQISEEVESIKTELVSIMIKILKKKRKWCEHLTPSFFCTLPWSWTSVGQVVHLTWIQQTLKLPEHSAQKYKQLGNKLRYKNVVCHGIYKVLI